MERNNRFSRMYTVWVTALLVIAASFMFISCEKESFVALESPSKIHERLETEGIVAGRYIVVFKNEVDFALESTTNYDRRQEKMLQASKRVLWGRGVSRVGGGASSTGTAWVLDTGIELDHPDLNVDNTGRNRTFMETWPDSETVNDGHGHGTHVAGTIAAKDNRIGVVGVAAGATVVAVKVVDQNGWGSLSTVIAGVDYVKEMGEVGDVANMSLGFPYSLALNDAVKAASVKVKFAIAAGNHRKDAAGFSPASASESMEDNLYTVSAIDINDTFARFSCWGNPPIDYAAPGVRVYSTWIGGGYHTISGTSMATPHVAGLLLLGAIKEGGFAIGDPDLKPDPIAVHDPAL